MIVCPFKDLGRYAAVIPGLEEAVKAASEITCFDNDTVQLSGGNKILVQTNTLKNAVGAKFEAHRAYLDIQYIVEGEEYVGWAPLEKLELEGEFNEAKDKGTYTGPADFMRITAGNCYVVYPEDGHMPGVYLENPGTVKKLVLKLKV